jgi:hypothetical protein
LGNSVYIPTLLKTDSQGSILWVANYSYLPNLGITSAMQSSIGYTPAIRTSDGGFVYWSIGQITKVDSTNRTQWIENVRYSRYSGLPIYWMTETSDGALAFLGVGLTLEDNLQSGNIYLFKTEPFLPVPSSTQLPTPLPTVPEFPAALAITFLLMTALAVAVVLKGKFQVFS